GSPAGDGGGLVQGAAVVRAGCDSDGVTDAEHRHRRHAGLGGAVAQLSAGVVAPAGDRTGGVQDALVDAAHADGGAPTYARDDNWRQGGRRIIAELPAAGITPAGDGAGGVKNAGAEDIDIAVHCNGGGVGDARHQHWTQGGRRGAIAQLAARGAAPANDATSPGDDGAGEVGTNTDSRRS